MIGEAAPAAPSIRPTRVRWRILALLVFVSFISYLLRGNLSIAAPSMIADLQLTEIQWGWIMSAFPLGYALFQFPGGCWADRKGPRRTLTLIAIAWAVLIAVASFTPGRDIAPLFVVIGYASSGRRCSSRSGYRRWPRPSAPLRAGRRPAYRADWW